jgi:hypothetical protein
VRGGGARYHCDNMLMVLAASEDMTPACRSIVTQEMIRGFADLAKEAGACTVHLAWVWTAILPGCGVAGRRDERGQRGSGMNGGRGRGGRTGGEGEGEGEGGVHMSPCIITPHSSPLLRRRAAETIITGGQTVLNPWPIIGGVAQVSGGCFVSVMTEPRGAADDMQMSPAPAVFWSQGALRVRVCAVKSVMGARSLCSASRRQRTSSCPRTSSRVT